MINKIKILGVNVDKLSFDEALECIRQFSDGKKQYFGVTPNPEFCLKALEDDEFLEILNSADLRVADGVGLLWAASLEAIINNSPSNFWKKSKKGLIRKVFVIYYGLIGLSAILFYPKFNRSVLSERVSGTDLFLDICMNFEKKVFLLGAIEGVAQRAKVILEKQGAKAEIVGVDSGSPNSEFTKDIIKRVNNSGAEVLFVAFGAPNQEKWISENLKKMPGVKFAMGIGGAFDFVSGEVKRAPLLFRKLGIEWLWRLFRQPVRVNRIYNAVIRFPLKVMRNLM